MQKTSRDALRVCAHLNEIELGVRTLEKDSNGAPIPFNGIYWSVSHKPSFASAVLSRNPVGIDIEEVKPRSDAVIKKVVSEEERVLGGEEEDLKYFFRVWTAKESVLKAEGIGLPGLSKCRVIQVLDDITMLLDFEGRSYQVTQIFIEKHVASVVVTEEKPVKWIIPLPTKLQNI